MTEAKVQKAQQAFEERKVRAKGLKKVKNDQLPAGAPMYYYCRDCGLESDVLPEGFIGSPRRYCTPCESLRDMQGREPQ
jgi:hypothetical protein